MSYLEQMREIAKEHEEKRRKRNKRIVDKRVQGAAKGIKFEDYKKEYYKEYIPKFVNEVLIPRFKMYMHEQPTDMYFTVNLSQVHFFPRGVVLVDGYSVKTKFDFTIDYSFLKEVGIYIEKHPEYKMEVEYDESNVVVVFKIDLNKFL